ncbi:hypothetical protein AGABI1DRAFT_114563 [Agaricus bisporus var. burnettii JB137-S8]|uniref:CsbD-like domain-containing protein n=1 Tax=Agaricus bisporus var. burnettii (strain JB137-S8 / ATCC MYA-4627 / FGSC 10392) TaxID=597362 RepID=K5WS42_AGABU|nr:uncharacterized protein AGABI1DRAFT_114563 [Agaricus bisporus var. burnettii JB137-S8]EKM78206.1 hypothetical protein AGABI1DRAFT_114563 [Agaricus bisporus var. burnettii JB137-S8]
MTSNAGLNNNTSTSEPSKANGRLHSVKGSAKETIGKVTGSKNLQQSGKEEHALGEAEYIAGQVKGYAQGTIDEIAGKGESTVGSITGNKTQQFSGNMRERMGQTQKKMN